MTERMRHPASEKFHQLLAKLGELHDKKQSDYGRKEDPFANVRASEEWGCPNCGKPIPAWIGAMIRLSDKIGRLKSVSFGNKLSNESAQDSFEDTGVYALIAEILFAEWYAPSSPLPTQPKVVVEIPHGTVFATPPQVVMPPMAVSR